MNQAGAAACEPSGIDDQILALWQALRTNPSLDARWATQAIDWLLDQRLGTAQDPPGAVSLGPAAGSPAQQAILAAIVRAVLSGESG